MKKGFVVVSIVLVLLMAMIVPASAAPLRLDNHCDENLIWSAYAPYGQNTPTEVNVGSVVARGVVYKNGGFSAFQGTLVKPGSGSVYLETGISGVRLYLPYDGALFINNSGTNYTAQVALDAVIMHVNGGWGRDWCTH